MDEWIPLLRSLKRGGFVAVGALSISGHPVDYPLKVMPFEAQTEIVKRKYHCKNFSNAFESWPPTDMK